MKITIGSFRWPITDRRKKLQANKLIDHVVTEFVRAQGDGVVDAEEVVLAVHDSDLIDIRLPSALPAWYSAADIGKEVDKHIKKRLVIVLAKAEEEYVWIPYRNPAQRLSPGYYRRWEVTNPAEVRHYRELHASQEKAYGDRRRRADSRLVELEPNVMQNS